MSDQDLMREAKKLARHAELMNEFGPDSEEATGYASTLDGDTHELAEVGRLLKKALSEAKS